ncbi:IclR family transcriptional regulator [Pseudodesulfovibrio thermohalotolerans]|uniref:IclR family transcriptional regulator n=1 Tax=Pseudodesulfovibrio thermohalotolerans TaxID=2880651 RepID=UPI002442551E|nr:IclR family transcriptional regulator [Pseudodesulfovibrio thermohalotolerans]WFS63111.1 IclR family transcriptional regulator [Pseudodesulfovibrio thermohalotolerans]
MSTTDKYYMMRSLEKALFVVETMATRSKWELKDLSAACSIPKGTLQRILRTLEDLGYVRQVERGGAYALSLKFYKLGKQIASQSSIVPMVQPIMLKLRDKVNETVNLSTLSGVDMVVIHQIASHHALQMDSIIGTSFPASLSASGIAFLAFLPEEDLRAFIKDLRRTNADIDSEKIIWLYKEIEDAREKGIGLDFEELFKGIRCIAAPVFDDAGNIVATLSCSVPTVRLDRALSQKLLREIPAAAEEASKLFEAPHRPFHFDMEEISNRLIAP